MRQRSAALSRSPVLLRDDFADLERAQTQAHQREAPLPLAEGSSPHIELVPELMDIDDLVQQLITPLTVLLAMQYDVVATVRRDGSAELIARLDRFASRGDEAMARISDILSVLRVVHATAPLPAEVWDDRWPAPRDEVHDDDDTMEITQVD